MVPPRIVQAAGSLALVLTLACGVTATPPAGAPVPPAPSPTPVEMFTPTPEAPTPEITGTQEPPLVQIGFFDSIYLRYDPGVWEAINAAPDEQLNQKGEPVYSLRHRTIPGCTLHDNLGRGVPPSWELDITGRNIGGLEFRVEAWTDTEIRQPVLTVYQYPPGEGAAGKRIELVIEQDPQACIESAEEVLRLSVDVIAELP